jgi:hypothetical protein
MDLFEKTMFFSISAVLCTVDWYDRIGIADDGTILEAIIDRIKHNYFEIFIDGKISMREHHGLKSHRTGGADNAKETLQRTQ